MAILYVTVKIRSPDDTELKVPTEDSYLCLTYAFVTMMVWIPFRMNTVYVKQIYFECTDPEQCIVPVADYYKDVLFLIILLIAYLFLTAGLLYKYRRWALGFLGTAAVALIVSVAIMVVWFNQLIAPLTEEWSAYVEVSIIVMLMLLALWLQFDPSIVRFNDFRKED
jgi:cation transport ATPase